MSTDNIIDKLKNDAIKRCQDRIIAATKIDTIKKDVPNYGITSKLKKDRGI
jgi:hypothetical protein